MHVQCHFKEKWKKLTHNLILFHPRSRFKVSCIGFHRRVKAPRNNKSIWLSGLCFYKFETSDKSSHSFLKLRLARSDYDHVQASSKPALMVLCLLDKLFSKETLLKSTLYGTKEFAALNSNKIAAIKGKLGKGTIIIVIQCSLTWIMNELYDKPKVVCVGCLTGHRASH